MRNVAWSQDNVRFASIGDDGVARIWDVRTGRQLAQLPKTDSSPCRLCWSSDGNTIATGHHDGKIQLWDGASYAAKGQLAGHKTSATWIPSVTSVSFSANGERLASYGWDQQVHVWDLQHLKLINSIAMGEPVKNAEPEVSLMFLRKWH